jgi:2-desacetyl-2-hydroxyethyl bacteriochlorophyllide A dehydrogenase
MDLRLEQFTVDADRLGETEVLVKNHYSAISAGTELSIYTGTNPRAYEHGSWCEYPFVPGYAGLGEVLAVGKAVTNLRPGDAIFHHSHHSSLDRYPVSSFTHVKISKDLVRPEVSLIRFALITLTGSVRLSGVEMGDKVAVFGLGLVGQMATQLFHLSGADVVAFDPVESRRKVAREIGACVGIYDPRKDAPKEVLAAMTSNRGVDILVEATGLPSVMVDSVTSVRSMGHIVLLGLPHGPFTGDVTEFFRQVFLNWITITGALERNKILEPTEYLKHSYLADVSYMLDLLRRGDLKTKELVSHVVKPDDFKSAYDGLLRPYEGRIGQNEEYTAVVVDWTE